MVRHVLLQVFYFFLTFHIVTTHAEIHYNTIITDNTVRAIVFTGEKSACLHDLNATITLIYHFILYLAYTNSPNELKSQFNLYYMVTIQKNEFGGN